MILIDRITFASGREGHMVDVLSYIHVDKRTPIPALLFFVALLFYLKNLNYIIVYLLNFRLCCLL